VLGLWHGGKLGDRDRVSSDSDALSRAIGKLALREDLSADETEAALGFVMSGQASEAQMSALLSGLRDKGETSHEVAGGVRALRRVMIPVVVDEPDLVVDTCGTGGGSLTTFNISTAAAFVLAGGGVPVAKHGNRSFSSRSGSADVLEALGIGLPATPQKMEEALERTGLSFLFAPHLHPAMKHVAPVRHRLGGRTIMNILGPLTNPANARRQVVGVAEPELVPLVAAALAELRHLRGMVVHGAPGMDELSPLGPTRIVAVENGHLEESVFDPVSQLGWNGMDVHELAGAHPEENARIIEAVLSGNGNRTARAAVVLNAGAGFYVAGAVDSLTAGVERAESALDEKLGLEALRKVREATRG